MNLADGTNIPTAPDPRALVSLPAIGLIVAGSARLFLSLTGLLVQIIFVIGIPSLTTLVQPPEHGVGMLASLSSGILGIAISSVSIVINLVLVYGAFQMKRLKSYIFSMVSAIIAIVPCFSLSGGCCCLGCFAGVFTLVLSIGAGIWAILVLVKPEVKAAFEH